MRFLIGGTEDGEGGRVGGGGGAAHQGGRLTRLQLLHQGHLTFGIVQATHTYHKRGVLKAVSPTSRSSYFWIKVILLLDYSNYKYHKRGVLKAVTPTSRSSYLRLVISLSVEARPTKMSRKQWFFSAIIWRSIKNGPIIIEETFSLDGNMKWIQFNLLNQIMWRTVCFA